MSLAVSQIIQASTDPAHPIGAAPRALLSRLWLRIPIGLMLLGVAYFAFNKGMEFRKWSWDYTQARGLRYSGDVSCGFGWGAVANQPNIGLFNVYDLYARGAISGPNALDYTPLRLTVVSLWHRWAQEKFGPINNWNGSYELTQFMLTANTAAELCSSIFVFLLIRMWIIRKDDAARFPLVAPAPFRGVVRGMLGAAFFWFNPAVVWDGHCFPQWDVWNTPFFLAAAYLACREVWFAAGLCVVAGGFFKGQILLVAPIFLIWPIVQLRFGAAIRFICGFVFGAAMIALPWFNASPKAIIWFGCAMAGIGLLSFFVLRFRFNVVIHIILALTALLLAWPWTSNASTSLCVLCAALVAATALFRFAPPRLLPSLYGLVGGITLLLLMPLYNASNAWFTQGFEYGTQKLMWMATTRTYSLPALLETVYGWSSNPRVNVTMPQGFPLFGMRMEFRDLMLYIHGLCLALCGVGMAIHARRNDPRFLVALVAPWLTWFAFLTQLNNRYLIWAAGFSALLVGVSWGMAFLGLVVTLIGWLGISDILHWSNYGRTPFEAAFSRILLAINSQMIYPILMLAAIYVYVAVAPRRRSPAPLPLLRA